MADAGKLTLTLTADQAEFTTGMRKASQTVNTFGDAAGKTSGHMEKFNFHMLSSRSTIGTFAAVTGQSAGSLHHLVRAFELAPGPIGACIAAFIVLKETYDGVAAAAERFHERNRAAAAGIEDNAAKIKHMHAEEMGKVFNPMAEGAKAAADEIGKEMGKKIDAMRKSAQSIFTFENFYTALKGVPEIQELAKQKQKFMDIFNRNKKEGDGHAAHGHVQAAIGGRAAEVFKAAKDPTIAILERVANGIDRLNGRREGMMG